MAIRGNRLHIVNDLALVPHVVAGGDYVGALVKELVGNARGHPNPAGRMFGVYHHQVARPLLDNRDQVFANDSPSGLAKYITDKKNTQRRSSLPNCRRLANDPATGTKWPWLPVC